MYVYYVCVFIYMYVYTYVYIYIFVYVYKYIYMHAFFFMWFAVHNGPGQDASHRQVRLPPLIFLVFAMFFYNR